MLGMIHWPRMEYIEQNERDIRLTEAKKKLEAALAPTEREAAGLSPEQRFDRVLETCPAFEWDSRGGAAGPSGRRQVHGVSSGGRAACPFLHWRRSRRKFAAF